LKLALEKIANSTYRDATDDFRNAYNHRFSRRFVIGTTAIASRLPRKGGGWCYAFGGAPAFQLDVLAGLLTGQRNACYAAFDAFRALVAAHAAAIAPINARQLLAC
jgi:hypothetical protein